MTSIRSIVAATDFSAHARHAAERAARLARSADASLTLFHALSGSAMDELYRWFGIQGEVPRALVDAAQTKLHALATDLAERHHGRVDERLRVGATVEEIVRVAEAADADVVVTGTRGSGFVRSHVIGSTAQRIVKRSGRPVLMVRQMPYEPYRRVLVPVDFSEWSLPAVETARCIAPDALFVLMHAVLVPFEGHLRYAGVEDKVIASYRTRALDAARDELAKLAAAAGLSSRQWIALTPHAADPWMQIVEQEQEYDCDLVVVGKHGRNALAELILGSTTQMVLAECAGDVLVSTARTATSAEEAASQATKR